MTYEGENEPQQPRTPDDPPSQRSLGSDGGTSGDITTDEPGSVVAADAPPTGPADAGLTAGDSPTAPTASVTPTDADSAAPAWSAPTASADSGPTPPLRKILEAILLVVDEPVPEIDLAQVAEQPTAVVSAALHELAAEYVASGRGFALRQVGFGWRLYTADDCAPYVERFVLDGQQARLTQAALETLAVVAYRQPVSRASIAAIRGVNVDGVVRTLVARGLIAESADEGPGGARLYVTTPYFLERLGLRSLDELPNLAPFLPASLEEIEREL